jgi:predicted dehydrogenase
LGKQILKRGPGLYDGKAPESKSLTSTRASSNRPLRAAILGAGLMGRWHADAVARAGGVVSAIVDPERKRAGELRKQHGQARLAASLDEILQDGAADVVHVCTPLETHEALAGQALRAGLHALVEKPLAPVAKVTAKLLQLAESSGRLLCPVHQFLFQPGVLRVEAELRNIGPILHVDSVTCSAGAEAGAGEPEQIAADILPHPLSLMARLLAVRVAQADWQVQHPAAGEIRAMAKLGNTSLSILISMGGRPTANALRLIGARGTAHVDLFHGFAVLERGEVSRARKIAHPFAFAGGTLVSATTNLVARAVRGEPAYPGLRELVRRFYLAAQGKGEPPIRKEEILDVAEARDALLAHMPASGR